VTSVRTSSDRGAAPHFAAHPPHEVHSVNRTATRPG
jgi:hypothetical protein